MFAGFLDTGKVHPARLHLNKGVRHRILDGHPWVFASEVDRVEGEAEDGGTVELRSAKGEFLGSAIYNSRSQIVARRYAIRNPVALDEKLPARPARRRARLSRLGSAPAWRGASSGRNRTNCPA